MAQFDDAREMIAKSCRILGNLGLTKGSQGHVSVRVEGSGVILIKARGPGESGVRFTEARDIITVDLDGKKLEGPEELEPPQEVYIHTWIYKTNPEMKSVVHVHPATVVLFTVCNKPLLPIFGAYDPSGLRLLTDGIPTYPRSILISNDERGKEFVQTMGQKKACLMRGHGIATAGRSVQEATVTAITLNEIAEMNYRAYLLGQPEPISREDIEAFAGAMAERESGSRASPQRGDARPGPSRAGSYLESSWRYYSKLADNR